MTTAYELDIIMNEVAYTVGFDQESDRDYAGNEILYPNLAYLNDEDGNSIDMADLSDEELDYISDRCCEFLRDCYDEEYSDRFRDDLI